MLLKKKVGKIPLFYNDLKQLQLLEIPSCSLHLNSINPVDIDSSATTMVKNISSLLIISKAPEAICLQQYSQRKQIITKKAFLSSPFLFLNFSK